MFRKLRNRILFMNMATLTVVIAAVFSAVHIVARVSTNVANYKRLSAHASSFTGGFREVEGGGTGDFPSAVPGDFSSDYSLTVDIFADLDGKIIGVASFMDMESDVYETALKTVWGRSGNRGVTVFEGREWIFQRVRVNTNVTYQPGGGVVISKTEPGYQISFLDVTDTNRILTGLFVILLLFGVSMLAVVFVISFVFANRAVKPVEESFERQRQFVADASHELRTPLTVIDANVEAMNVDEQKTVGSQRKWLDYIKTETKRMNLLIGEMLYLSKSESVNPPAEETAVLDFGRLIEDAVMSMEAVAFESGASFVCRAETGITVKCHGEKLDQIIHILLDNALKYAEGDRRIEVLLSKNKGKAVLRIKNPSGITPEELAKVFDRFYRGDPSRNSAKGGYGLGLSIAKSIAGNLGGALGARTDGDGFVEFSLTLKCMQ